MSTRSVGISICCLAASVVGLASTTLPANAWDSCASGYNQNGLGRFTECVQNNPLTHIVKFASGKWIAANCVTGRIAWSVGMTQALGYDFYNRSCGLANARAPRFTPVQQMGIDANRILMEGMTRQYDYR